MDTDEPEIAGQPAVIDETQIAGLPHEPPPSAQAGELGDTAKFEQEGRLRWGIFRMTRKAPTGQRSAGIEVECFMHRRNAATGCKKWIRCDHGEQMDRYLRLAKSWAVQVRITC